MGVSAGNLVGIFWYKEHVIINTDVDAMPMIKATFAQAEAIENTEPIADSKVISKWLAQWITPFTGQTDVAAKVLSGY